MYASNIVPTPGHVVLKPIKEKEHITEGGLILPSDENGDKELKVVEIVHSSYDDFPVGDKVIVDRYSLRSIYINGEKLYIIKEDKIIAFIK